VRDFLARIDRISPQRLSWVLLVVWLGYSGGALAWLHLSDPPLNYCVTPRR
jgi:hypothetical protein